MLQLGQLAWGGLIIIGYNRSKILKLDSVFRMLWLAAQTWDIQ